MIACSMWGGFGLASSSCAPDLGACDPEAARRVVYDQVGVPAYEGQALVRTSCGGDTYCHSAAATHDRRFGVPAGLDFDMAVLTNGAPDAEARRQALSSGRRHVTEWRHAIFEQVEAGDMPPWGRATLTVHELPPRYSRIAPGQPPTRLPHVDSHEGLGALRNWLSCGAPVVERTEGTATFGDVVPTLPAQPR